jgi:nucleotide-binding universal stress UspA family protein
MFFYSIRLSSTSNTSRSKFSRIMVAIDGSEHSLKAAEYALEIAKSFNSQLFAVTVTFVPESYRLRQEDVLGNQEKWLIAEHGLKILVMKQKQTI